MYQPKMYSSHSVKEYQIPSIKIQNTKRVPNLEKKNVKNQHSYVKEVFL